MVDNVRIGGVNYTVIPRLNITEDLIVDNIAGANGPYVIWRGPWVDGQQYFRGEMVTDQNWLMIANKPTYEQPSPQNTGSNERLLPVSPGFSTNSLTGVIEGGFTATIVKSGWIRELEVWVPTVGPTISHSVNLQVTQFGSTSSRVIPLTGLVAGQWNTVSVDDIIVTVGAKLFVLLESIDSSTNTTIDGDWTFTGNDQSAGPASGSWNRNNQNNILRINKFDDLGANREADLLSVIPDTDIVLADQANASNTVAYNTNGVPVDQGTYVQYDVTLISESGIISAGTLCDVTIVIPVPASVDFVQIDPYWSSNQPDWATITGILRNNGLNLPISFDIAYGCSVTFQPGSISEDWDFASFTTL